MKARHVKLLIAIVLCGWVPNDTHLEEEAAYNPLADYNALSDTVETVDDIDIAPQAPRPNAFALMQSEEVIEMIKSLLLQKHPNGKTYLPRIKSTYPSVSFRRIIKYLILFF